MGFKFCFALLRREQTGVYLCSVRAVFVHIFTLFLLDLVILFPVVAHQELKACFLYE